MGKAFGLRWAVVIAGAMLLALVGACSAEPEIVEVDRIVEVEKEVVKEVPVQVVVEKEVVKEVPVETVMVKEVPVDRIVEKVVEVEKEVVKEVPVEVVVEKEVVKTVEVEKPVIVRQEVVKEVEVEVVKEVEVEVVKEVEVVREVERIVERVVEVPKEVPVVKLVEVEKGLPALITDPDAVPGKFSEAPILAALVKEGKLPPVEERVPEEPAVIKPTDEIGKYGGTWRTGFTGPGDGQNIDRIQHNHLLFFDAKVETVTPWILKGWEISDGGRTFTFFMRKGMKWSDGHPFTTEDVMFWYQDMYQNDDLVPAKAVWNEIGGVQGVWEAVDSHTFTVKFPQPYEVFIPVMASIRVSGHWMQGKDGMGAYAPKHYMQQFHPKYAGQDKVDQLASEEGYDNWVLLFKFKNDPKLNVDAPVLTPWKMTTPINTPQMVLERNPYYFAVDTAGNQLPYFDKIVMGLAEDLEVLNLRAIAGEYDIQGRHVQLPKVPVLLENQEKGNYNIRFWRALGGSDSAFYINQNYDADPEIGKWLRNKDFRIALSTGFDRDQLNEIFWLGTGNPGSACPAGVYGPGPEWRKRHATFDPDKANELLDSMGLDKKDSEGFRLRTDNGERLVLEAATVGAAFMDFSGITENVAEQLGRNIGIKMVVKVFERSLLFQKVAANELQLPVWSVGDNDDLFLNAIHTVPVQTILNYAPKVAQWTTSGGQEGEAPTGKIKEMLDLFDKAKGVPAEERIELAKEVFSLLCDNVFVMGTVGQSPALMGVWVVSNDLGNVPMEVPFSTPSQTPGNAMPEQWYFKK